MLAGPGVDRVANLLVPQKIDAAYSAIQPRSIFCLYVLEHVWDIHGAAAALASLWKRDPESWLWVSTHQTQPYHATAQYGDYWRLTATGLRQLLADVGVE